MSFGLGESMPLVVFDMDGTLTHTTNVDDALLVAAICEVMGVPTFDSDWSNYPHATDGGICQEVSRRFRDCEPTTGEIERIQKHFFALLREHASGPAGIRAVAGAAEFIRLLQSRGFAVSLATGAWRESARIKLFASGLQHLIEGDCAIPAAYADESISRAGISQLSIRRAGFDPDCPESIVYVGDGVWDAQTSAALGLGFVGVRVEGDETRLRAAGAREIIHGYEDPESVLGCIERELRESQRQ